ncbi:MAG: M23 family metallopeptidase [Hespellia sp.]|nr:M23 family metallopeptidase [Hespellia sp.]
MHTKLSWRKISNLILLLFLLLLFISIGLKTMQEQARYNSLPDKLSDHAGFRSQQYNEKIMNFFSKGNIVYKYAMLYSLETSFGERDFLWPYDEQTFASLEQKWKSCRHYPKIEQVYQSLWQDLSFFPVPESLQGNENVTFADSWMNERTYGGKRGHEGTDLMAAENIRGYYPVVSMTDGVVESMGWLEKGGYRIGILAPHGGYFYYAHLDSYASLQEGDEVQAGEILGYMGDSGYGPEGTIGMFPVHLHVGIYLYEDNLEVSVNPYWMLRYLSEHKLKCIYS